MMNKKERIVGTAGTNTTATATNNCTTVKCNTTRDDDTFHFSLMERRRRHQLTANSNNTTRCDTTSTTTTTTTNTSTSSNNKTFHKALLVLQLDKTQRLQWEQHCKRKEQIQRNKLQLQVNNAAATLLFHRGSDFSSSSSSSQRSLNNKWLPDSLIFVDDSKSRGNQELDIQEEEEEDDNNVDDEEEDVEEEKLLSAGTCTNNNDKKDEDSSIANKVIERCVSASARTNKTCRRCGVLGCANLLSSIFSNIEEYDCLSLEEPQLLKKWNHSILSKETIALLTQEMTDK